MTTPILAMDELEDSQEQPHVPINAGLRTLEVVGQLCIASRTETSPPPDAEDGTCFIVGENATDDWENKDFQVTYKSGGWLFLQPQERWLAWVQDEQQWYMYTGDTGAPWVPFTVTVDPSEVPFDPPT